MKHEYKNSYKNVFIRQLNENDLGFLREWRNNLNNSMFLRKIPYITSEMQQKWFQLYLTDQDELIFAIVETEQINHIVGSMALYNFTEDEAEFGKILIGESKAHGMNIGVNALIALEDIAKRELALKKLYLHVYSDNISAIKVYKKAGFEFNNEHEVDNGKLEYTMSILL